MQHITTCTDVVKYMYTAYITYYVFLYMTYVGLSSRNLKNKAPLRTLGGLVRPGLEAECGSAGLQFVVALGISVD